MVYKTWLLTLCLSLSAAQRLDLSSSFNGAPEISITSVTSTTRWETCDHPACLQPTFQLVEVVVNNTGESGWITTADHLTIEIQSAGLNTVRKAYIKRLMPGDAAIVEVGVQNAPGVPAGVIGPATAVASWGSSHRGTLQFNATFGISPYQATATSINTHQSPSWFRRAKFGIFIHWGVYSVPAYGNIGKAEGYAEWYWNHQQNKLDPSQTWQYHLNTYGAGVVYDDFITNFTVEKFNPKEWVDLIAESGAKYFVPTTKHHDGFALFSMPSTVSERNSVKLTPHRDLIKELFDAAVKYQPQLQRGTYFSLPEWFNPAYTEYGDGVKWGIGPPKNPYDNKSIPYLGYTEVNDFVTDIQVPQMDILISQYNTSIMWCDIGRASKTDQLFAGWLNQASAQNHQVTFNSRCGTTSTGKIIGDYQTPEYKPVNNFSPEHWEACRGLDPHSFGYNKLTPDNAYMNATAIVQTIVDIVAKNGNLLLDIGPRSDGTIPEAMSEPLLEAGKWLKSHSESIYDSKYWPTNQGTGNFRYTVTDNAFYIHTLVKPYAQTTIPDKVPYLSNDKVVVIGGKMDGRIVPAQLNSAGYLVLTVSEEIAAADNYTWTFKISY